VRFNLIDLLAGKSLRRNSEGEIAQDSPKQSVNKMIFVLSMKRTATSLSPAAFTSRKTLPPQFGSRWFSEAGGAADDGVGRFWR